MKQARWNNYNFSLRRRQSSPSTYPSAQGTVMGKILAEKSSKTPLSSGLLHSCEPDVEFNRQEQREQDTSWVWKQVHLQRWKESGAPSSLVCRCQRPGEVFSCLKRSLKTKNGCQFHVPPWLLKRGRGHRTVCDKKLHQEAHELIVIGAAMSPTACRQSPWMTVVRSGSGQGSTVGQVKTVEAPQAGENNQKGMERENNEKSIQNDCRANYQKKLSIIWWWGTGSTWSKGMLTQDRVHSADCDFQVNMDKMFYRIKSQLSLQRYS